VSAPASQAVTPMTSLGVRGGRRASRTADRIARAAPLARGDGRRPAAGWYAARSERGPARVRGGSARGGCGGRAEAHRHRLPRGVPAGPGLLVCWPVGGDRCRCCRRRAPLPMAHARSPMSPRRPASQSQPRTWGRVTVTRRQCCVVVGLGPSERIGTPPPARGISAVTDEMVQTGRETPRGSSEFRTRLSHKAGVVTRFVCLGPSSCDHRRHSPRSTSVTLVPIRLPCPDARRSASSLARRTSMVTRGNEFPRTWRPALLPSTTSPETTNATCRRWC
jgi:hypothetical protein